MPYRLLADEDTEYEVVQQPTAKQQREFNQLQLRAAHIPVAQKQGIAKAYGWEDKYTEDGDFQPPTELDIETFRVKAAQIVFEGFDKPLNDKTRDNLLVGEVMDGVQDFLSQCGGSANEQQTSSADLTTLLNALSEVNTGT